MKSCLILQSVPRKSRYLQIRVTPEQKTALERLASRAGLSVSAYVLSRVLPPVRGKFRELVRAVQNDEDHRYGLAELSDWLAELTSGEFLEAVGEVSVAALPPYLQNYVAAMVELAACHKGVSPPEWVSRVEPLSEPHFATSLCSLRLHLLRTSPVPFRRRNIFVDSTVGDRV